MQKLLFLLFLFLSLHSTAQTDTIRVLTLADCIDYAETHYPLYRQADIDRKITTETVMAGLAAWYPQINFNAQYNYTHNNQVINIPIIDQTYPLILSQKNSSPLTFSVNQVVFDRDAFLHIKNASQLRRQANLTIEEQLIYLKTNVTKAFYNVMLQITQMEVYETNVELLQQSLEDAQDQYEAGIVDKTDVQRSLISLNNAVASYDNSKYMLIASYADLYMTMGYIEPVPFVIYSDLSSQLQTLEEDIFPEVDVERRVEYQLLEVKRNLLKTNLAYSYWSFLPTVSLFGYYDIGYSSAKFRDLYKTSSTNYSVGVTFSIPLFEGFARVRQTRIAKLNLLRNEWDLVALQSSVNEEYTTSLAVYKSNLENYNLLRENMEMATEVYEIIQLQYKEGIKTFLDLTIANSDLLNAQLSYYNSIFQLLSSRIDVEKSLGIIK